MGHGDDDRRRSVICAASECWSVRTSTCPSRGTRSATTDGSGRACRRSGRCATRAHVSSSPPTSDAPRASPTTKYSLAPVARRLGELLGSKVAFARTPSGPVRGPPSKVWVTARSPCWRTCGSTPARPARTTPSAVPSPSSWRLSRTCSSPTVSGSCTASRPACTTWPSCSRTRWAAWSRPRSTCCGASPTTRSGPMPSSSAGRRSPTRSASSTTCSARPTGS